MTELMDLGPYVLSGALLHRVHRIAATVLANAIEPTMQHLGLAIPNYTNRWC